MDKKTYSKIFAVVLLSTLILNAPLLLLVYTILPQETILNGTNILSILADTVSGKWLRIIVVVDCVMVMAGSVIGGICSTCSLLERLAKSRGFLLSPRCVFISW